MPTLRVEDTAAILDSACEAHYCSAAN